MKKLLGLFAVGSALFLGGVAQAQPGAPVPGAPGSTPSAAMAPAAPATASVSVTQTTTPDTYSDTGASLESLDAGTMPTTGGAPIAMALSGLLAAGGAFFARRKLA